MAGLGEGPSAGRRTLQIIGIPLVNVLFSFSGDLVGPVRHQLLADGLRHVEKEDEVGPRQAEEPVFVILEPMDEGVPLGRVRDLPGLVHEVRRGVAVGDDDAAFGEEGAGFLLIRGVAVRRKKRRRDVGADGVGVLPEIPGQIMPGHRRRVLVVARVGHPEHRHLPRGQGPGQPLGLGLFACAVDALDHDQPAVSFCFHGAPPAIFSIITKKTAGLVLSVQNR